MATRRWLGNAANIKQVATLVIGGTWLAADTITLTIDNVDFVVTIGSLVTTAQVATTVQQAFQGTTFTDTTATGTISPASGGAISIPQFSEFVATVSSSTVTFTAVTAGKPITMSAAKSSTSGTITYNNTATTATGKHHFSNPDNWSGNTVPVDADTIVFDEGNVDCKYDLSPSIQPTLFIKTKGYSGRIGLLETNVDNQSKPYAEYRTKYLTFDDNSSAVCTYELEGGTGQGSGLVRIDAGAGSSIFIVYGRGNRVQNGTPCILLKGTNTANVLRNIAGDVGAAFYGDEAITLASLQSGSTTSPSCDTDLGPGVTATNLDAVVESGNFTIRSAFGSGSLTQGGGTVTLIGSGAIGDVVLNGGKCRSLSSGTIATLAIRGGHFDKTESLQAQTITAQVELYKGAKISDPAGILAFGDGLKLNGCRMSEVSLDLGVNRELTVA